MSIIKLIYFNCCSYRGAVSLCTDFLNEGPMCIDMYILRFIIPLFNLCGIAKQQFGVPVQESLLREQKHWLK